MHLGYFVSPTYKREKVHGLGSGACSASGTAVAEHLTLEPRKGSLHDEMNQLCLSCKRTEPPARPVQPTCCLDDTT